MIKTLMPIIRKFVTLVLKWHPSLIRNTSVTSACGGGVAEESLEWHFGAWRHAVRGQGGVGDDDDSIFCVSVVGRSTTLSVGEEMLGRG
jgi:hypothetical protein